MALIIEHDWKHCNGCPLDKRRSRRKADCEISKSIPTKNGKNKRVSLMVITGQSTANDANAGRTLASSEGRFVKKLLAEYIDEPIVFSSCVKCPVPEGTKAPADAIKRCGKYLAKEMKSFKPRTILVLGSTAMNSVGVNEKSVREARKIPLHKIQAPWDSSKETSVVTSFSPTYIESNPSYKSIMRSDILARVIPATKNRGKFISKRGEVNWKWENVDTVSGVKDLCNHMMNDIGDKHYIGMDLETNNLEWAKGLNKILTLGFSPTSDENIGWSIPYMHPETPFSPDELVKVSKYLKKLFKSKGGNFRGWIAHNAQFEIKQIHREWGIWWGESGNKPIIDTQLAAHLIDENRKFTAPYARPYALENIVIDYLGYKYDENLKDSRDRLAEVEIGKVLRYNAEDAVVTSRLWKEMLDVSKAQGYRKQLIKLCEYLYSPTCQYMSELTINGQGINIDYLMELLSEDSIIDGRLNDIVNEFKNNKHVKRVNRRIKRKNHGGDMDMLFGGKDHSDFNLGKTEHLQMLFFDELKLAPLVKTKKGVPSVNRQFQDAYSDTVPLVGLYQERQQLTKLSKSYLTPIANFLETPACADGRIHPNFHLNKTVTGRASASNPNSQQMPRSDSPAKRAVKCLFQAKKDHFILEVDYSQAEVRWLGIISGDESLAAKYSLAKDLKEKFITNPTKELEKALKVDGDLHMSTALDMFNLPRDLPFTDPDLAKKKRQGAKSICFGLIYGKHFKSLAKDLGIEEDEAESMMEKWLAQFPQASQWLIDTEAFAERYGYVESPLGRRRRLPAVFSQNQGEANRAKRQARNSPIQGAAADTCTYAATKIIKALHKDKVMRKYVKLVNTVHDSVISEVHKDVMKDYCLLSKSIMCDQDLLVEDFGVKLTVPMECDFEFGPNWGSILEYNLTDESLKECLHDAEIMRSSKFGTTYKELKSLGLLYVK